MKSEKVSKLRSTWYIEFLPTSTRGMLMAAYSIGWPMGRAVVISVAYLVKETRPMHRCKRASVCLEVREQHEATHFC